MIYSDFRVLKPLNDGDTYGLPKNKSFESDLTKCLTDLDQAMKNDSNDAEIKLLKDLNFLKNFL